MTVARLPDEEVARRLRSLPGWKLEGKAIVRHVALSDFRAAIAFVNRVAALAEEHDHHPDIAIHYRTVTLTLWTHVADGLTERDFAFATDAERLEAGPRP